jgi:hypothetical protein
MACPVPVQEWLRGWSCGDFPFGRRPRADSRVRLTDGRRAHSSRSGDVLSPRVLTASGRGAVVRGMAAQRRGWPHRTGGDGGGTLHWPDVTALSCAGVGEVSVSFSRVLRPPSRVRHVGRTGAGGTMSRS